ncbi:MAG: hypothetical protein GY757_05325 [bacterium]|nr:hypothetical protein [bacterium]
MFGIFIAIGGGLANLADDLDNTGSFGYYFYGFVGFILDTFDALGLLIKDVEIEARFF